MKPKVKVLGPGVAEWDVKALDDTMVPHGFRRASNETELIGAHRFSEKMMGMRLAPITEMLRIEAHTGSSVWVAGDAKNLTGINLIMPLTKAGQHALHNSQFTPGRPDLTHIGRPGEPAYGMYIWLFGATDNRTRIGVLRNAAEVALDLYAAIPIYARGATREGIKAMKWLGFTELDGSLPDLFYQEPTIDEEAA